MTGFVGLFDTARDYTVTRKFSQLRLHCRCLVAAANSGPSRSFVFPNCPRPQLRASHSNSSQRQNLGSPLTR
jgi:hypothetical protein